jgi:murein DD-endopeptidase MepM/ murein hydrolase activator NlpD
VAPSRRRGERLTTRKRKPANVLMPLKVFPVDPAGHPRVSDDFGKPRGEHGERSHQGNDIFAPEGTPVLAVDDGKVTHRTNKLGGTVAFLHAGDGTRYYYAHLSAYEGPARTVKSGEVIGYVGRTGNAATTAPHLHFEVSPSGNGRDNVNPFPLLQDVAITATPSGAKPKPRPAFTLKLDGLGGIVLVVGVALFFGKKRRKLNASAF